MKKDRDNLTIINGGKTNLSEITPFIKTARYGETKKNSCINGKYSHGSFTIDSANRIINCDSCGKVVSAFYAMEVIAMQEGRYHEEREFLKREMKILRGWKPFLRALKALEKIWRKRNEKPRCPHCKEMLEPQDLLLSIGDCYCSLGKKEYKNTRKKLMEKYPNCVDK